MSVQIARNSNEASFVCLSVRVRRMLLLLLRRLEAYFNFFSVAGVSASASHRMWAENVFFMATLVSIPFDHLKMLKMGYTNCAEEDNLAIAVCMNAVNSATIKARKIKFGMTPTIYHTQINITNHIAWHAHRPCKLKTKVLNSICKQSVEYIHFIFHIQVDDYIIYRSFIFQADRRLNTEVIHVNEGRVL